jgi:hypothetical protein
MAVFPVRHQHFLHGFNTYSLLHVPSIMQHEFYVYLSFIFPDYKSDTFHMNVDLAGCKFLFSVFSTAGLPLFSIVLLF